MKKIVFLLGILMVGCIQGSLSAEETIRIDEEVIDGSTRLVIEGTTHHPFRIVRGDEDNRYYMTGHLDQGDVHAVYGYASLETTPSFYDGFVVVFDKTGEILMEETIDFDHLEEVMDVHLEDESLFVHLRQSVDNRPEGMIHRKDLLLEVREEGVTELHESRNEIKRVHYERGMFYFSESYQGHYEKGIDVNNETLVDQKLYGLESHGHYDGSVTIHSFCESSSFEEEVFTNSLVVDYPGHYALECDGDAYTFTVNPQIEGVKLNDRTIAPVAIEVSGGRTWLNDDLYINGELVANPGYHTLKVEGTNDYLYTAPFTLESGLEGVEEGGVYTDAKTLFFSGEGVLNDETIVSGHTLKNPGSYTLKILGQSDYEEVVSFEILEGKTPKIEDIPRFELAIAFVGIVITSVTVYFFLRKR
ncbi:MAG: hypothetical protein ACOCSM_00160 [Bacillota bacterium]